MRRDMAARRRALDPQIKKKMDARIGARLIDWWRANPVPALAVYWPLRGEPDLLPAYAELERLGVRLALPVVVQRDAPLAFADWQVGEDMVKDEMGVAIPVRTRMVNRPPAVVIPCLGYTAAGYRLGYGGGYYDRTLAQPPRPLTVGVAYACTLAEFPADAHDVALDVILTEA